MAVFLFLLPAFPCSSSSPFPILVPSPLGNIAYPYKKAILATQHRADMQLVENIFRNDTVEILKVLEKDVLETSAVHEVTFEDGCMLPVLYKEFYILHLNYIIKMNVK